MAGFSVHSVTISSNKIKEIVKLHQKKYRRESGLFIAEGLKVLQDCIENNVKIKEVFALKDVKIPFSQIQPVYVDEAVMKKISTTDSPCEILTVAYQKKYDIEQLSRKNKLALFENISDPGNLGTIIRSASAFNIEGIILFGDCIDLYSSKVIRSCAGNFFKIPMIEMKEIITLKEYFNNHALIATALSKTNNITLKECSDLSKYVIMFGSEAKGLSKELINISEKNIRIDMKNNVESLNLAVCASIIFYELFKL